MKAFFLTTLLILTFFLLTLLSPNKLTRENPILTNLPIPTPTPIQTYLPPTLPQKEAYTLIFVGDSMTQALGPNFDELRLKLKDLFPNTIFGLFNYGFPATNLLSVDQRLTNDTVDQGQSYQAILDRQFDVIIIESFGHNPLSEYPLAEGLALQTKTLDSLVLKTHLRHPNSVIIFLATIAPSKTHYALSSRDLSPAVREQWANERIAYIENHLNYANSHHIPLINVYESSLTTNRDLDLKYVSSQDYIHPSSEGIKLISNHIGSYLFENIIPHP